MRPGGRLFVESLQVNFGELRTGENYERPALAALWGYRDWHALGRGAVTPAQSNKIILFITKNKQSVQTPYENYFDGDRLLIEGETNHAADERIISAKLNGDAIHLFYRHDHHSSFTYFGEIHLSNYQRNQDRPSRFEFMTARSEVVSSAALSTDQATQGEPDKTFIPDPEGQKKLRQHVVYERSQKNRAQAIKIHGTTCAACSFNFDDFYGGDLAKSYIQIHHIHSITKANGPVDPSTDLIPLCSNCHSMVHSNRNCIMPVEELRDRLAKRGHERN